MKKIFVLLSSALLAVSAGAQDFVSGDNVLGANVGFGGHGHKYGYKMKYDCARLPLQVSYERCVADGLIDGNAAIGVGGNVSYGTRCNGSKLSDGENKYKDKWRNNCLDVAVFSNFHYQFVDKLDTYVGMQIGGGTGFYKWKHKVNGEKVDKSTGSSADIVWGMYVGARYYIAPSFAVAAELGGGIHTSILKVGMNYRF